MKGLVCLLVVGWQEWHRAEHLGSESSYEGCGYLSDLVRYLGAASQLDTGIV